MAFQFTQTGQELQDLADTAEKIAAEYDETASWTTGDYCTHEGTIYRCTASTTGTFDASSWTAVILCDELEGLQTRMSTAEGDISALNTVLTQSPVAFNPTFSTTPNFVYSNCFYDPISKMAYIDFIAYWTTATATRGVIGSVPYHPVAIANIWGLLGQGSSSAQAIRAERCFVGTDGSMSVGDFVSGYATSNLIAIKGAYRTA